MAECFCDINAYALKGLCECEEGCSCSCDICECDKEYVDMWSADLLLNCACGGNCTCGQCSDEIK